MVVFQIFCLILSRVLVVFGNQCESDPCEEQAKFWLATTRNDLGQWTVETGLEHPKQTTSSGWRLQVDNERTDCSGEKYCRLVATLAAKCVGTGASSASSCSKIIKHKKKRFQLYNEFLTWDESKTRCKNLGGNLAVPRVPEDIAKIQELVKSSNHAWIFLGFSDLRIHGVYEDVYGDEVKPYWAINQPDNIHHRCGCTHKTTGLMYDGDCAARVSFICEFDQ